MEGSERIAIEDDLWQDMDPEAGMGRVRYDEPDPRRKITDLKGLKVLKLVLASMSSEDEEEEEQGGDVDDWRFVQFGIGSMIDYYIIEEVYVVPAQINGARPEWKQPEVELARLIYV